MDKDKSKRWSRGKPGERPSERKGERAGPIRDRVKPVVKRPAPHKSAHGHANASKQSPAQPPQSEGDRIAKVMARAGLCSRRDAEAWISQGRVAVNGKLLTSPAVSIGPNDEIHVDGQPLAQRERTRLFLFHKPRGLVTTNKDPEGRATVFDYLKERHPDLPRLVSVGRLDINTEGLLLLTNDGGLARVLELPTTGWLRRYRVRANGETDQAVLDRLRDGVTIEGIHYAAIEAALDRVQGANIWLTIGLREGKNREIKRVLEHLGLVVNRLIRLSFGPFQLGELADGAIEEVRTRVLRDQLGATLAAAAGVDFESEIAEPPARREFRPPAHKQRAAGAPQRGGLRPHRASPEPEVEPAKPRTRPKPGPRKHVSALRGEEAEAAQQGRRRTLRGETQDRKGRSVVVERRVAAVEPGKTKTSEPKRVKRKPAHGERPEVRAGVRARDERSGRPPRRDDERTKPPRGTAESRQGPPRGAAPSGQRPPHREGERTKPPRGAASFGQRPPRGPAPSGKRPSRGGDAPSGKRPPRGKS
ncbi:MAG: pseudouridine synthase [Beijerinckiaceae bacterium]